MPLWFEGHVYWSRRACMRARARYFGCHYPYIGVSSEGIAVILCDITLFHYIVLTLFHLAHPNVPKSIA